MPAVSGQLMPIHGEPGCLSETKRLNPWTAVNTHGVASARRTLGLPVDRPKYCNRKVDAGPCRAAFRRWYFNVETGNCEAYIWGGYAVAAFCIVAVASSGVCVVVASTVLSPLLDFDPLMPGVGAVACCALSHPVTPGRLPR